MQTERQAYNQNKKLIQNTVANLSPNQYLRLRKLSPRESRRLMGISEKHIDRMLASGNSEEQLYKQAGNSIVVDVLYHLFRKMIIDREPDAGTAMALIPAVDENKRESVDVNDVVNDVQ